jgi:hypothetical protein
MIAATMPTPIDGLLAFGIVVVAPLAATLVVPWAGRPRTWTACGAAAAVALVLERGSVPAVVAALPWSVWTSAVAVRSLGGWWAAKDDRRIDPATLAPVVAPMYLAFGAGSLVFSRAGLTFRHLVEPIVELTAVHYTYAGFVATTLAWCLVRRSAPTGWTRRASTLALTLFLVAPPVVAAGFFLVDPLPQVGGATLLLAATWTVAIVTLATTRSWLLRISSLSVFVPMLLAVSWAAAQFWDVPALSIPAMARTHGTLNALGFGLLGVLGRRREPGVGSAACTSGATSSA